jgi:uncharacterized Tic20 family protein
MEIDVIVIYWLGVAVSLMLMLFFLTITKDNDCNIKLVECVIVSILVSLIFSWLALIIMILAEIRERYIKDK